jgi:hypothetical protein
VIYRITWYVQIRGAFLSAYEVLRHVIGPPYRDVSLRVVASIPFDSILAQAFGQRFRIGRIDPKGIETEAFRRYEPETVIASVRARLIHIGTPHRKDHEKRLIGRPFMTVTFDGGHVGFLKFSVTNLAASSLRCCFTG